MYHHIYEEGDVHNLIREQDRMKKEHEIINTSFLTGQDSNSITDIPDI